LISNQSTLEREREQGVSLEEMSSTPHPYVIYVVYAWVSLKTGLAVKTYIGITNRLGKRLNQHRGVLAGGAKFTSKYTKTGAEWTLSALAHGFTDRQDAEKVEWALQNPQKSRHFKRLNPHKKHDLAGIIQNLKHLNSSKGYERIWFTLHNLPEHVKQALLNNGNFDLHNFPEPEFKSAIGYTAFLETINRRNTQPTLTLVTKKAIVDVKRTYTAKKMPTNGTSTSSNREKRKYLELAEKSKNRQNQLLERLRALEGI
jgi:predicted GIY-YIG superfamily endonuclease